MEQKWFEMADIRKRRFNDAVWIPLRASQTTKTGKWGYVGYKEEYFGAGSLAVPLRKRVVAEKLTWTDLGLMRDAITPAAVGPQFFREAAEVINAAAGGPPDRAKMIEIMLRHGLTPAPTPRPQV